MFYVGCIGVRVLVTLLVTSHFALCDPFFLCICIEVVVSF